MRNWRKKRAIRFLYCSFFFEISEKTDFWSPFIGESVAKLIFTFAPHSFFSTDGKKVSVVIMYKFILQQENLSWIFSSIKASSKWKRKKWFELGEMGMCILFLDDKK
ncbi:hypothetical protein LIU_04595 [Enterococcus durans]|nr:hypothetical protein LIANG_09680 [Enterococcus durans]AKZ47771.1 hypothetical protein LIU_04595 [Enterococcus durans]